MRTFATLKDNHPNLYITFIIYAVLSILIGLNFLFLRPAFMPLDIPKWLIGIAFLGCGLSKLVILLLNSHTRMLRHSMAISVFLYTFWAGVLTFDFFRLSQTSMQLPLTFMGLAALGYALLREPFTNPASATSTIPVSNGK